MKAIRRFFLFLYRKIEQNPLIYRIIRDFFDRNPLLKGFVKKILYNEGQLNFFFLFRKERSFDLEERFFISKLKSFKSEGFA